MPVTQWGFQSQERQARLNQNADQKLSQILSSQPRKIRKLNSSIWIYCWCVDAFAFLIRLRWKPSVAFPSTYRCWTYFESSPWLDYGVVIHDKYDSRGSFPKASMPHSHSFSIGSTAASRITIVSLSIRQIFSITSLLLSRFPLSQIGVRRIS